MAPKAMTPTSTKDPKSGNYGDFARRRRAHSKDDDSPIMSRFNASPSKQARALSPMSAHLRRRNLKGRNFMNITIIAADLLILGYALRSLTFFFSAWRNTRIANPIIPDGAAVSLTTLPGDVMVDVSLKDFQSWLPDTPACDALQPEDVAYTLALHLSESRLWMMQQHCALWGETAPISVAIWTAMSIDETLESLKNLGCKLDYITLHTLDSQDHSLADYPINQLRNLALSGVATSHALLLDVDMFPSIDLFDTLNIPIVREALAGDPKLALVVPAFQAEDLNCGTSTTCLNRHLYWMPKDFEDLVIGLGSNKIFPYDPTNFAHQGSTNYRRWMSQAHGELIDIPCVSSNHYQPYMVLRLCSHLPPLQEAFVGYGHNNAAWMMHLRRVGYRLQQVGGSFVTHFPHPSSLAKTELEKELIQTELQYSAIKADDTLSHLAERTLAIFTEWLHTEVDDSSRLDKCDDFEED